MVKARVMSQITSASLDADLRALLADVLGLTAARVAGFTEQTPLFGALPELDSMAVAGLFTALEDRFGFILEEDEIDGDLLETYGALHAFVARKLGHA
jgi:acyl carrier protein